MSTIKNSWPGLSGSATASTGDVVRLLPSAGYEKVHVAYSTTATRLGLRSSARRRAEGDNLGFLARAVGWFSEQGITCRRSSGTTAPPSLDDLAKKPVGLWI